METVHNSPTQIGDASPLQTIKAESEKITAVVKEEAGQTAAKVKQEAKAAVGNVKDAGLRFAESQQSILSDKASELAGAVKALCGKLDEAEEPNLLVAPAQSAGEQLTKLADYLKNSSPAQVMQGAERLARSKPELVYGGLFLAGLIVARFLKASGSRAAEEVREADRQRLPRTQSDHAPASPTYFNPANV